MFIFEQFFMKGTEKTIKTQRLIIRKFVPSDWRDLLEYLSDPRVVKYEPYEPINKQQSIEIAKVIANRINSGRYA